MIGHSVLAVYVSTLSLRGGADKSLPDQEGKKLQRPTSGFIQRTPHETQYNSQPVVLTLQATQKKISEICPSNQVSAAAMTSV